MWSSVENCLSWKAILATCLLLLRKKRPVVASLLGEPELQEMGDAAAELGWVWYPIPVKLFVCLFFFFFSSHLSCFVHSITVFSSSGEDYLTDSLICKTLKPTPHLLKIHNKQTKNPQKFDIIDFG